MKKILYSFVAILATSLIFLGIYPSNNVEAKDDRNYNQSPVKILQTVQKKANPTRGQEVQSTDLDNTTSTWCKDIGVDSRFTFTRTLCYIKNNVGGYLQYVMYFGLTLATILLIVNGFKLVTSQDREKEMKAFTKNLIYIVVGVTLLLGFYYFIDIYVGVINLFSD